MANPSVQQDPLGPDWPLGFIKVAAPSTPVGIMSLVDPTGKNNPATQQSNQGAPGTSSGVEFPVICNQIQFQGFKPGAAHGTQNNTGNVYVMRTGAGGDGTRDDDGSRVATIAPGQTYVMAPPATRCLGFSPYRYFLDADNANDGAYVTLLI